MLQVLVVDDDQGMRETCGAALRHVGYGVHTADCGSAAITMLSSGADIHALLLDLKLADMTGYDVLRWMRTQVIDVPTAVMTAFRAEFEPDEAIALGALAYADQPLSLDDLLALVENLTSAPSPRDDPLRLHQRFLAGHPGALDAWPACISNRFPRGCSARFRACRGTSLSTPRRTRAWSTARIPRGSTRLGPRSSISCT